ncbi:MAG: hypothetical protein WD533_09745 [Dehalococcoidia bacterium]
MLHRVQAPKYTEEIDLSHTFIPEYLGASWETTLANPASSSRSAVRAIGAGSGESGAAF